MLFRSHHLHVEWLATQFDMKVVVTVRHPAAFVSSIKALNWPHDFRSFASQPLLMEHILEPFAEEILAYASDPPGDIVDRSILFWKCGYHVIGKYREAHPDWLFVRHEDLSRAPADRFRELFKHLGLDFGARTKDYVMEHTTAPERSGELQPAGKIKRNSLAQTTKWKSLLTAEEVERIRTRLEPWWRPFYSDEDW